MATASLWRRPDNVENDDIGNTNLSTKGERENQTKKSDAKYPIGGNLQVFFGVWEKCIYLSANRRHTASAKGDSAPEEETET